MYFFCFHCQNNFVIIFTDLWCKKILGIIYEPDITVWPWKHKTSMFHSEILASLNINWNKILSPGLENNQILKCCSGNFPTWFSQIQGTRSEKDGELRDKSVLYFQQQSGPCPLVLENKHTLQCWSVFFNNFDMHDYVWKLHFSVWLFSNSGDKVLFLLKFNEVRIS